MAKVTPAPGQAVEETTVTRLLPDPKAETEKNGWDALEYMDSTPVEKWNEGDHIIYVYRVEPILYRGASGPAYVTKYATPVSLEQIQKEYGGGLFRLVIKRGNERMADSRYQLSGAPRDLTRANQEFSSTSSGGASQQIDSNSGITPGGVVSKAMDMVGNTEAQRAQVEMVKSTATEMLAMARESVPKQMNVTEIIMLAKELAPKANSFFESPLGVALAGKLIDRLFSDPADQFIRMADVMSRLNGGSSTNDWKAALVNAAPQLANAVKDTVHELRMGTEAQMQLNAGRTLQAAPPAAPAAQQNPAPQNVVEMPAPAQTQGGPQPMEPFEMKLVELLNDPQMTGDKAGEILDQTWPRIVDEVSRYSVDQIIMAFGSRPLLAPHKGNPRLRQFLTEFLQWANETDAPLTPTAPAS